MLEAVEMQVMGRGNKGRLGTCGLGPYDVRVYLWGDGWMRISVARRRTWLSPSLTPHPCAPGHSQCLPCLEVTPGGVSDHWLRWSHWPLLFFPGGLK